MSETKLTLVKRKEQLTARLAELGERLDAIDIELESHHDPDWSERAVEREADEVLEATGIAGQTEVRQIRAALRRIAQGSYGACVKCGEDITDARLDVLPWTPLCRSCA